MSEFNVAPSKKFVLVKQSLSTVQDGEDKLPFSNKMDAALNFIEDVFERESNKNLCLEKINESFD